MKEKNLIRAFWKATREFERICKEENKKRELRTIDIWEWGQDYYTFKITYVMNEYEYYYMVFRIGALKETTIIQEDLKD